MTGQSSDSINLKSDAKQRLSGRTIDPITATGALLALIAVTALITYAALTVPSKLIAAEGPPEEFRIAATQQAQRLAAGTQEIPEGDSSDGGSEQDHTTEGSNELVASIPS